jgi:hypothetical protein
MFNPSTLVYRLSMRQKNRNGIGKLNGRCCRLIFVNLFSLIKQWYEISDSTCKKGKFFDLFQIGHSPSRNLETGTIERKIVFSSGKLEADCGKLLINSNAIAH